MKNFCTSRRSDIDNRSISGFSYREGRGWVGDEYRPKFEVVKMNEEDTRTY